MSEEGVEKGVFFVRHLQPELFADHHVPTASVPTNNPTLKSCNLSKSVEIDQLLIHCFLYFTGNGLVAGLVGNKGIFEEANDVICHSGRHVRTLEEGVGRGGAGVSDSDPR